MANAWLTANEAATALGVSVGTLYAYVSRGAIRSQAVGGGTRAHRYSGEDVAALLRKRGLQKDPTQAVADALDFGMPVLDSAIALIEGGHLYYRGRDACELASRSTLEDVARLIWAGDGAAAARIDWKPTDGDAIANLASSLLAGLPALRPIERFAAVLPVAGAQDVMALDVRPGAVAQTGARILSGLVAACGGTLTGRLAQRLAAAWAPDDPHAPALIDAALILCADHELNVSAFTARCVASAGGTPYHVVSAGLAALQGAKHGGHTERVEALLAEIGVDVDASAVVASRLRRGEDIPGFGHRLYPMGDPRAEMLIALIKKTHLYDPALVVSLALADAVSDVLGERPTIDFGLATLAGVLRLPPGSALALFALGRTVGWIGHAIEQIAGGRLIRPRARYTGPRPRAAG